MSYLTGIASIAAPYKYTSAELVDFMDRFIDDPAALRKLKYLWKESGIRSKHAVLPDFKHSCSNPLLFKGKQEAIDTESRMAAFDALSLPLAAKACQECLKSANINASDVDAIIAISCTGLSAPGLEIKLAKQLELRPDVDRHAINFMGCYAAFHGMRLADLICKANPTANVLVVCTELCSLHFRNDTSDDNLLSTTLFADGAGAMIWSGRKKEAKLKLAGTHSVLIPSGANDMAWKVGNNGFEMVLNKNVPRHIERNMRDAFLETLQVSRTKEAEVAGYAIHPGGKNVLKAFASALGVSTDQLDASFSTLENYGNLSSASIIFVIQRLMESLGQTSSIYAAAFGPGLTVESAMLTSDF